MDDEDRLVLFGIEPGQRLWFDLSGHAEEAPWVEVGLTTGDFTGRVSDCFDSSDLWRLAEKLLRLDGSPDAPWAVAGDWGAVLIQGTLGRFGHHILAVRLRRWEELGPPPDEGDDRPATQLTTVLVVEHESLRRWAAALKTAADRRLTREAVAREAAAARASKRRR